MSRLPRLASCLLLAALAAALGAPAAAQDAAPQAKPAQKQAPKATAKSEAKPKAKASKSAQARNQAGKALLGKKQDPGSGLSKDDLSRPYSAGAGLGPPAPPKSEKEPGADNATGLDFDLEPKQRPFAKKKKEEDSSINFRIGRDQVVDPITGRDVGGRPDAAAAKERLKNMDLKGALEKTGGKAEVQVDILKF